MIKCDLHDYVEIACMYHFEVRLELKTGDSVQGEAVNIENNHQRQECLLIENASGKHLVVLDSVEKMQAITKNPHFDSVLLN